MADVPVIQVYENGFRNVVLGISVLSDGSGVSAAKIFDATASGAFGVRIAGQVFYPGVHTKLAKLKFDVQDQKFQLLWEASTNVPFLAFGSSPDDFDWTDMGGLYPPPGTAGLTGSILLTTIDPMPDATLMMTMTLRKGIHQ